MEEQAPDSFPQWLREYQKDLSDKHSEAVFSGLRQLTQEEISNRAKEIRRLLRASGYGLSGDSMSWQPDPIPYVMSDEDWNLISSGIVQRMGLLQRIMSDLQGEQSLISSGLLKPGLFMAHPAFLAESSKFPPSPMLLAGFDVAKQADGQFRLIRDHFQFPKGLGVQLENRIISRRVMSEEFSELGIERIVHFFKHIQQSFSRFSTGNQVPRVVILSEGSDSPDYTEQAYLATFMDLILARSADLTVREGNVWIKALDGLRKVDVIIRWIPDNLMDSLEQPQYSEIGVPGLFSAIRSGNVAVFNGPGTCMLQIPAVHQAIPAISEYWLQQPLILPQLETQPFSNLTVVNNEGYQLKHYTNPEWDHNNPNQSEAPAHLLFWQQQAQYDCVPFWSNSGLQDTPFYFRFFAYWDGYQVSVLPAALCTTVAPIQGKAHGIKDTWITKVGATDPASSSLKIPDTGEDIALIEGLIPSRAAENLFWLGAGLERCENLVRLLRVFIDSFTELTLFPDEKNSFSLAALKSGILEKRLVYPYQKEQSDGEELPVVTNKHVVWQCMSGGLEKGALSYAIDMVLSSAKQIRELLSYDTLRILDTLQTINSTLEKLEKDAPLHRLQSILDRIIAQIMAFNGSIGDSLSLNSGMFMTDMGRRLERSVQVTASFRVMLIEVPKDGEQMGALDTLLLTQVSAVTHRRRYRMSHNVDTGIELLLIDAQYPRSLAFQIEQLLVLSEHLPSHQRAGFMNTTTKLLLQLKTLCALAEPAELAIVNSKGKRFALEKLIDNIGDRLEEFRELLQLSYFSHTQPASKLAWSDITPIKESDDEI